MTWMCGRKFPADGGGVCVHACVCAFFQISELPNPVIHIESFIHYVDKRTHVIPAGAARLWKPMP